MAQGSFSSLQIISNSKKRHSSFKKYFYQILSLDCEKIEIFLVDISAAKLKNPENQDQVLNYHAMLVETSHPKPPLNSVFIL